MKGIGAGLAVAAAPSALATTADAPAGGRSARPPNIVLMMTDDQGYGELACHGNKIIKTPNLDALHARSLRFTDFHVSPTCAPTRESTNWSRPSIRIISGRQCSATPRSSRRCSTSPNEA